jgi:hypothetical protein
VAGGEALGADLAAVVNNCSNLMKLLQSVQGMGVSPAR